jgi:hypothetical protein
VRLGTAMGIRGGTGGEAAARRGPSGVRLCASRHPPRLDSTHRRPHRPRSSAGAAAGPARGSAPRRRTRRTRHLAGARALRGSASWAAQAARCPPAARRDTNGAGQLRAQAVHAPGPGVRGSDGAGPLQRAQDAVQPHPLGAQRPRAGARGRASGAERTRMHLGTATPLSLPGRTRPRRLRGRGCARHARTAVCPWTAADPLPLLLPGRRASRTPRVPTSRAPWEVRGGGSCSDVCRHRSCRRASHRPVPIAGAVRRPAPPCTQRLRRGPAPQPFTSHPQPLLRRSAAHGHGQGQLHAAARARQRRRHAGPRLVVRRRQARLRCARHARGYVHT